MDQEKSRVTHNATMRFLGQCQLGMSGLYHRVEQNMLYLLLMSYSSIYYLSIVTNNVCVILQTRKTRNMLIRAHTQGSTGNH